jgi:hypothetical protein
MTTQEILENLDEMQNQLYEFKIWLDAELEIIDKEIEELKNMKIVYEYEDQKNDLFVQKEVNVKKNYFSIFDFKNFLNCVKLNYSQLNNYGWLGWEFLKGKACPRVLPYFKSGVKNKLERGLK